MGEGLFELLPEEFRTIYWTIIKPQREAGVIKTFLIISDEPGIGVSLRPDAAERFPWKPRKIVTRLHYDGSVVDQ